MLLKLRQVREEDSLLFFSWANDNDVRKNAINYQKIEWGKHIEWFKKKMQSQDTYMFIAYKENDPIGQIRFDKEQEAYMIDYSIAKEFRGMGFGTKLVEVGINELFTVVKTPLVINALVKQDNIPSAKVFERLLFTKQESITTKNGINFLTYSMLKK